MDGIGRVRQTVFCLVLLLLGCGPPEDAGQVLADGSRADHERLAAARQVLAQGAEGLVAVHRHGDNARIIRRLLDEERQDERALDLALGLFVAVAGEERLDFEVYVLRWGQRAVPGLLPLLEREDSGLVLQVLDALGKLQARSAAAAVAAKLGHGDPWIRMGAAHALGEMGAREQIPQLMAALQDADHAVVNAALVGLGRLRAVEAVEAMRGLAKSANPHVRKHAAQALGRVGLEGDGALLVDMVATDTDTGVRYMATRALAEWHTQQRGEEQ